MRKFLSVSCSSWAFNLAMLILRVVSGAIIISIGYSKLVHFAEMKKSFMNFLGIGSTLSLILVIFAEFFCGILLVLGLFTRLAAIPLIIAMSVALFKSNNGDLFGNGAMAAIFLTCFLVSFLCGPGKASADGLINR